MPHYDWRCRQCHTIWMTTESFQEFDASRENRKCPSCEASDSYRYMGDNFTYARTNPLRMGDLMEKDSWARNHTMPEEYFRDQTKQIQEQTRQRDRAELKESGQLSRVNEKLRKAGLPEY